MDPKEEHDLADEKPDLFESMKQLYELRAATTFVFDRWASPDEAECRTYVDDHQGFVGPMLDL